MVTIAKGDNSFIRIFSKIPQEHDYIRNCFKRRPKNFMHMPSYKIGRWNGFIELYKQGKLPYGLYYELIDCLVKANIEFSVDTDLLREIDPDAPKKMKAGLEGISVKSEGGEVLPPMEHQLKGYIKAIKYKRGIIKHATGSGKSFTIGMVINYYRTLDADNKILIVVPETALIAQTRSNLIEYGFEPDDIGIYYGEEKKLRNITIATWQSIRKFTKYLKMVNVLIVDEAHIGFGAKNYKKKKKDPKTGKMIVVDNDKPLNSSEIQKIIVNCEKAKTRLAFTGTLPDDDLEFMTMMGCFGPILHEITSSELQDKNQLAGIKIKIVNVEYEKELVKKVSKDYHKEVDYIANKETKRYKYTKAILSNMSDEDNAVVLFGIINHGKRFYEQLKKDFPNRKVHYIDGSIPTAERENIRQTAKKTGGNIIVASKVFQTGIDIPRLHIIIMLAIGKSYIKTIQSVGRGLRLHESKENLKLYDFTSNLTYENKHVEDRMRFYLKEGWNFDIIEKEKQ